MATHEHPFARTDSLPAPVASGLIARAGADIDAIAVAGAGDISPEKRADYGQMLLEMELELNRMARSMTAIAARASVARQEIESGPMPPHAPRPAVRAAEPATGGRTAHDRLQALTTRGRSLFARGIARGTAMVALPAQKMGGVRRDLGQMARGIARRWSEVRGRVRDRVETGARTATTAAERVLALARSGRSRVAAQLVAAAESMASVRARFDQARSTMTHALPEQRTPVARDAASVRLGDRPPANEVRAVAETRAQARSRVGAIASHLSALAQRARAGTLGPLYDANDSLDAGWERFWLAVGDRLDAAAEHRRAVGSDMVAGVRRRMDGARGRATSVIDRGRNRLGGAIARGTETLHATEDRIGQGLDRAQRGIAAHVADTGEAARRTITRPGERMAELAAHGANHLAGRVTDSAAAIQARRRAIAASAHTAVEAAGAHMTHVAGSLRDATMERVYGANQTIDDRWEGFWLQLGDRLDAAAERRREIRGAIEDATVGNTRRLMGSAAERVRGLFVRGSAESETIADAPAGRRARFLSTIDRAAAMEATHHDDTDRPSLIEQARAAAAGMRMMARDRLASTILPGDDLATFRATQNVTAAIARLRSARAALSPAETTSTGVESATRRLLALREDAVAEIEAARAALAIKRDRRLARYADKFVPAASEDLEQTIAGRELHVRAIDAEVPPEEDKSERPHRGPTL